MAKCSDPVLPRTPCSVLVLGKMLRSVGSTFRSTSAPMPESKLATAFRRLQTPTGRSRSLQNFYIKKKLRATARTSLQNCKHDRNGNCKSFPSFTAFFPHKVIYWRIVRKRTSQFSANSRPKRNSNGVQSGRDAKWNVANAVSLPDCILNRCRTRIPKNCAVGPKTRLQLKSNRSFETPKK